MTHADSAERNVQEFFHEYGNQIRGAGSDEGAFINALRGRDAMGDPVHGWKVYNRVNQKWPEDMDRGIRQMRRDIPNYLRQGGSRQAP